MSLTLQNPEKAQDSRWLLRSRMDWTKMARRHDLQTVEGRLFSGLLNLIQARKPHSVLHNFAVFQPMRTDNEHVLVFGRRRHDGHLLVLANFHEHAESVQAHLLDHAGICGEIRNLLAEQRLFVRADRRLHLKPYETLWLVGED